MIKALARPKSLRGRVTVPGDKSMTHRALIFNAMARGPSTISGYSRGEDCLSTLGCLRHLGVMISRASDNGVELEGGGRYGFLEPREPLDAGNSGTTMRLISGLLAGQPFTSTITGDGSLRARPMGRVLEPLRRMGARTSGADGGELAPLTIHGGGLHGIHYSLPVASAQVKSAVLIAGLYAEGETIVEESAPSRDHTERMLHAMGADLRVDGNRISVRQGELKALDITVPGDISSAAYWILAAVLHPDADVLLSNVGVNPTRCGILDALADMGADIGVENRREVSGEPVADLRVRSSRLKGITVGGDIIPRMIDELPLLALAGVFAEGETEIRDAAEMRVKESDRIAATATELSRLGADISERDDGLVVKANGQLSGGGVESHGDHRLAMTLAVAGLLASGETLIQGAEAADVSYPDFWAHLRLLTGADQEPAAQGASRRAAAEGA